MSCGQYQNQHVHAGSKSDKRRIAWKNNKCVVINQVCVALFPMIMKLVKQSVHRNHSLYFTLIHIYIYMNISYG